MRSLSFSTKISLALILAATVPLAATGYGLASLQQQTLKDAARELYITVAQTVAARLEHETAHAAEDLEKVTTLLGQTELTQAVKVRLVSDLLAQGDLGAVGVYDTSGQFIDAFIADTASGDRSPLPERVPTALLEKLRASTSLRGSISATGAAALMQSGALPSIPVAVRWEVNGNFFGVLLALVGSEKLCGFVAEASQKTFSGNPNRVWLVNDSLRLIALHDRDRLRQSPSMLGTGIFSDMKRADDVSFSHAVGIAKEYASPDSATPMLGAIITLPALGLAAVIEQPQAVAYQAVAQMRRAVWFWTLISGAAAALISVGIVRQLTRPIRQLAQGAEHLAAQDFSIRIENIPTDEFGILFSTFNRVAEELGAYQKLNVNHIIAERNKLLAVVRQAGDGILIIDVSRTIVMTNDRITQWFSLATESVEGKSIHDAAFDDDLSKTIERCFESAEVMMPAEFRLHLIGEVRETVLRGGFVKVWREQELIAVLGILRDVTKEVEIDRLKTDLVSIVAHELRSPLANIQGFSDLIAQSDASDKSSREFAGIIFSEAERLSSVITKFLDINRLESGRTDLQRLPFRLDELIRMTLAFNDALAQQKNITVLSTDIPSVSKPIVGDADAIGQVILNLFSNAVKYSDEGKTIRISMHEEAETIKVCVADEGYGISAAAQQKLFTKFFRATDDERVRQKVGTGLGLAFIKEIVENHGGTIGAESELGKGSTFWFTLPK